MQRVKQHELGEAVVLDADSNVVRSPFADLESLPLEVTANLKRSLKSHKDLLGDSVARAFLQGLVHLIGGYRDALRHRQGEAVSFDQEKFVTSRPAALQPFLTQMLQLQVGLLLKNDALAVPFNGIFLLSDISTVCRRQTKHA